MSTRLHAIAGAALATALAALAATIVHAVQLPTAKPDADNERTVSLVPQDQSDCTNSTVQDNPNRTRGGTVLVSRGPANTRVEIAITGSPNTKYHFFLKCVRLLGDIGTNDEGIGQASFEFSNSSVGPTFAFDMYPEGAPAGNKFQSLTVRFP